MTNYVEYLSWLAGIAAGGITLWQAGLGAMKFWRRKPADGTGSKAGVPMPRGNQRQSAGANSTQIHSVTGNITINHMASSTAAPAAAPISPDVVVAVPGKWDKALACAIALQKIEDADWPSIGIHETPDHVSINVYSLIYRDGKEGRVLVYASTPLGNDCHACAPYLSFFEFDKVIGGWDLSTFSIAAVQDGAWGEPPMIAVQLIADARYGVLLKSSDMAQGWGVTTLKIYTKLGDSFDEVLELMYEQHNPDGLGWKSELAFRPSAAPFYEIDVRRSGNLMKFLEGPDRYREGVADWSGNVRPADTLRFDGRRYTPEAFIS